MKAITRYILASSLVAILTITLFGLYSLEHYHENEVEEENERLESCIRTFRALLAQKGTDFRIVDGKLLAGSYPVNGNFELPDKVQEIFGGVATIFMGDERVSTNVLDGEGKRAVGTRLVGPPNDAIFKQGKSYRGVATILDVPYFTAYDPIRDGQGRVIGVLFVGIKESEFLDRMHAVKLNLSLTLLGMVTFLTILMVLLGRAIKRVEGARENQIKFQQTLVDTIPNPVFYKDANCRYLGCNKAFETYVGFSHDELIGKTPKEIWPEELAERYLQQDLALLENPGMQFYEAGVRYADGSLRDVIFNKATFSGSDGSVAGLVGVILDITERKRVEDALAFQNILLSAQQEASIDGLLVVDENAKILSFNRRFVEIMGIPSYLLESREDEPVLRYVTGRMVDPQTFLEKVKYLYEHRQEICRDELILCDGKTLDRYTVPLLDPDGRYCGRLWSFRDITERKAAEEEIKYAYQQLFDIVEFLPDATFVVDKEKRVIAWNRAIEQMTGLKKADVMGKGNHIYSIPFYNEPRPILIDLVDEDLDAIRRNYSDVKKEGRTLFAETYVPSFQQGGCRYFWGTATPLFDKLGNQVGAIESIRDITGYRQAEQEKFRLETQLHQAHMMENVVIRLGHDLKTPLTPLFVMLSLLKKRLTEPDLIKMVEMCIKNATSINNLADKSRILATLSSRLNPHELEVVPLASIADQALVDCADMISHKQIDCRNVVGPAVVVHVVPDQLLELFVNLISNAVRFSHEKGCIVISAEQHAGSVQISVQDAGVGLAPDHLDHVFDEFFKADESRHDIDAPGLGLSICKRIVRNHQGRIWAESPGLGLGTTIKFSINENVLSADIQ